MSDQTNYLDVLAVNILQRERIAELESERDKWKDVASQVDTYWIPENRRLESSVAELSGVLEAEINSNHQLEIENTKLRKAIALLEEK